MACTTGSFIVATGALMAAVFFIGPMIGRGTGSPSPVAILAVAGFCILVDRLQKNKQHA